MEAIQSGGDLKVGIGYKQIISIALPITIAIVIPQVNLLINSIFLGHLDGTALGNAGITGVYYLIFAVAGNGLNNALQTVFSRFAGSGDTNMFKYVLAQGLRISLSFAVICIAFTWFIAPAILKQVADSSAFPVEMQFLRIRIWGLPFLYIFQMCNALLVASLNSRLLMIGFVVEAAVNIFFDYGFIFGNFGLPALGFDGAAYASVLAEFAGMVSVLLVLNYAGLKKRFQLFSSFRYDKQISNAVLKVSVPLVSQYIISVTTWLIFFLLIETKGEQAKAISNVMRNVFGLAGIFVWALAGTSNAMVSNLMGQQRQQDVFKLMKRISLLSISCCFVISALLNLFPAEFFNLFGQDQAFVEAGVPVIRMVSLGMLVLGLASPWLNAVTGTGRTKVNLAIEIIAIFLYLVYTWYFMVQDYRSLSLAWSNEFIYWTSILIISYFYMRSGKWKTSRILGE